MKRQSMIWVILGGLLTIASTVWYLVIYPGNEIVGATGYLFLLLSIIVLFGGLSLVQLLLSEKKNFLLSAPFTVLVAYFFLSVVLSLVFMIKPVEKKSLLIVIQILLLALATLSLFMMLAAEHSTPTTDFKDLQWNDPLREAINKIRGLKDDPENTPFKELLSKLYQRSVFLDTTLKRDQDEDILKGIKDLEIALISREYEDWQKKEKVEERVGALEELLKQREYHIRENPWSK